jgi:hypothetical protein
MSDVFQQLRKKFDGADSFVAGGHAVRGGGFTRHAERLAHIPAWANDDVFVRKLLLKVFPKLATDQKQRDRAGTWFRVIVMYYRLGYTHLRISQETGWTHTKVESLIRNIKRASEDRQASSGKNRNGKRGRPKKNVSDNYTETF